MTWQTKKLGEVCEIGAGNSAPQNKELFEKGSYPFFRTSDVGKIHFGFVEESADRLNAKGIRKLQIHKKGSLLFPKSGASTFLNHRVLMGVDGYVSSHLAVLKAINDRLEERYLLYFSMTVDSRNLMQDQNYPSLRLSDIQDIEIPLPPLPIQRLIVKKLDKIFAGIEKAKQNAEKNLKNSRELFESYLQDVFAGPEKGWKKKRLGEVCSLTRGHNPPKSRFIKEPKKGYVRFYQIRDGWSDKYVVYVPDTPQLHKVRPDEILMVAYRHIGKVFRGVSGAFNVALCKISNIRRDILDDEYLLYMIPTDVIKGELMRRSGRSLIPSMSVGHLKEIVIPLPLLSQQKAIVKKLNALSGETKKLEAIYQKKLADLDELKKSVLKKAFEGEL